MYVCLHVSRETFIFLCICSIYIHTFSFLSVVSQEILFEERVAHHHNSVMTDKISGVHYKASFPKAKLLVSFSLWIIVGVLFV